MQTVLKCSELHHSPPGRQAGRRREGGREVGRALRNQRHKCFNNIFENAAPSRPLRVIGRDGDLFRICQRFRIGFEEAKVRVALEAAVRVGFKLTVNAPRRK